MTHNGRYHYTPTKPVRKQTKTWTTKDGCKLRICDMEDEHLSNTLKMLVRYCSYKLHMLSLSAYQYAVDAPDGAASAASREADQMLEDAAEHDYKSLCEHWPYLLAEATRRGFSLHYKDGVHISKLNCFSAEGVEL